MVCVIKKGRHRGTPNPLRIYLNKTKIVYDVYFNPSCKYDLGNQNQHDVNKLFGIGYIPHHKESARFGWRYNKDTEKILLSAYCYVKGERIIKELCEVPFFRWQRLELVIFNDEYMFTVADKEQIWNRSAIAHIDKQHNRCLSYRLGLYFGGDEKAPREMSIEIKKVT